MELETTVRPIRLGVAEFGEEFNQFRSLVKWPTIKAET